MNRVIAIIMLALFPPPQLYAASFTGFGTDTQVEYFVPRGPDLPKNEYVVPKPPEKLQEQRDQKLTEKILEEPPKVVGAENSDTNWWLWGGLAVVAGGVAALAAGGGGSPAPTAITTGSGTVSW